MLPKAAKRKCKGKDGKKANEENESYTGIKGKRKSEKILIIF